MLCAFIFIHKWRDLQFKVDSERQIFYVCEVSYASYILFFTVNVMLTATVNIIEKFGKERKANRLKIGKIGIN